MPLAGGKRRVVARAIVAGVCAGFVAAAFFAIFNEPSLSRAIALEEHAHVAHGAAGAHAGEAEVARSVQRGPGLFLATALAGGTFGALLAAAFLWGRASGSSWRRAAGVGAALYGAIVVVPWLKYPPNPPGVGRADTIGQRQSLYLLLIACTVLLILAAIRVFRTLANAPEPRRITTAAAALLIPLGVLLVWLPGSPDPVTLPASLVWEFRVTSLAGNTVLWLLLTLGFGLLTARAGTRAGQRELDTVRGVLEREPQRAEA